MASDEPKVLYKFVGKEGAGFIPGVPAQDLTDDDWKGLTKPQKVDIKGSLLYKAVEAQAVNDAAPKPAPATVAEAPTKKEG